VRVDRLQRARVVALQIVGLIDERVDIVVGVALLDGKLAVLNGLVVILRLVIDLRERAQPRGQVRLVEVGEATRASSTFSASVMSLVRE
jgi:hypothetical protein